MAPQQIIVKQYKGNLNNASDAFQKDAVQMAQQGYSVVSQNYQQGSWGIGAFILAIILFVILVGILVFIYMLIVKPAGTLVVTYQYVGQS